jgi:putative FmdB family regulatory protein
MPIYEYRCGSCGHQQEFIQKVGADPLTDCPACEEPALRKLVSAAAFHLKGSGWYQTDFKDGGKQKPDAKDEKQDGGDSKDTEKAKAGEKTETVTAKRDGGGDNKPAAAKDVAS